MTIFENRRSEMTSSIIRQYGDASIIRRFFAFAIDVILFVVIPLWVISFTKNSLIIAIQRTFVIPIFFTGYQTYFIHSHGQTMGGKYLGIRVAATDNLAVPLRKAFFRGLFVALFAIPTTTALVVHFLVTLCIIATILLPPDPKIGKRRNIFDLLAGTCVIRVPKNDSEVGNGSSNHK